MKAEERPVLHLIKPPKYNWTIMIVVVVVWGAVAYVGGSGAYNVMVELYLCVPVPVAHSNWWWWCMGAD